MRSRDEQQPISPSERARAIVTNIVARHGLLQAVDIGQHVQAQLGAMVEQQRRAHPEEWAQSVQTHHDEAKKIPPVPKIGV